MSTVYLRIDGTVLSEQIDGESFPLGRRWDDVPAVGDLVVEHALNDYLPRGREPRYLVARRTFLMWNEGEASYPYSPSGVLLDLTTLPEEPGIDG